MLSLNSSKFFLLKIREGVVTEPWNREGCKIHVIPCKILVAQWTNEFLVVEFCVFPTKVNRILTLGVTMEISNVR